MGKWHKEVIAGAHMRNYKAKNSEEQNEKLYAVCQITGWRRFHPIGRLILRGNR